MTASTRSPSSSARRASGQRMMTRLQPREDLQSVGHLTRPVAHRTGRFHHVRGIAAGSAGTSPSSWMTRDSARSDSSSRHERTAATSRHRVAAGGSRHGSRSSRRRRAVISNSKSFGGAIRVTRARQSYSGPNQRTYSSPLPGVPLDRFVHHASSPSGVLTASNTRSMGALIGKSWRMSAITASGRLAATNPPVSQ